MAYSGVTIVQQMQLRAMRYLNRPTANSTAAIVIWLTGTAATKTFLGEIGVVSPEWSGFLASVLAFVTQALLTILEGPIWHRHLRSEKRRTILGVAALVVDTALNMGGCWYFLQNLGNTTFWHALSAASGSTDGPSSMTILLLSFALGLLISAGPEALWDI